MTPRVVAISRDREVAWPLAGTNGRPERLLVAALSAILMFSALAFGSVDDWAVLVLRLASVALLLGWLVAQRRNQKISVQRNAAYLPCALFGLLLAGQIIFGSTVYHFVTITEAAG